MKTEIGNLKVVKIKRSQILVFYSRLSDEGLAHNTIKLLHSLISPALEMAINDDIIRKNPAKGALGDYGEDPKTEAGVREIPMTQTVYQAFRRQKELNFMLNKRSNIEIGMRSNFIFVTKNGRPIMPAGVNSFLKNIVNAYNKREILQAEKERRKPELMPHISAHILRHTGCTRLGEQNVNPKVMQYVMGHSDMGVTMNVYNHIADLGRVEKEMLKM